MKHILIACLVFALCLAVGLFSLFYVRASGEETVTLLERSIRQAEEEQYTAAAESLRQANELCPRFPAGARFACPKLPAFSCRGEVHFQGK